MQIPFREFEQYIDEAILTRGLSYFKKGRVSEPVEIRIGEYEAVVKGTEEYIVKLFLQNGILTDYYCSCPYDMGPVCKHIAAVLFSLQQDELGLTKPVLKTEPAGTKKPKKRKSDFDRIKEILEIISHDELKGFVLEESNFNSSIAKSLIAKYGHQGKKETREMYANQVKRIIRSFLSGKNDFIHPAVTKNLGLEISRFLDLASTHIKNRNYLVAFYICTEVMEQLLKALDFADDSYGGIGGNIDTAFETLNEIAKNELSEETRKVIYNYCTTTFEKSIFEGWEWHRRLLSIASMLIRGDEEKKRVLDLTDKITESEYAIEDAQIIKYEIILKFDGKEAAENYLESKISNPAFRMMAINLAISKMDFEKAIFLAKDGIEKDNKTKPGLVKQWLNELLKIAQIEGKREKIIEYAKLLLLNDYFFSEYYYKVLKAEFSANEWKEYVENLLDDVNTKWCDNENELIPNIFIQEEWWKRLMEYIKKFPSFENIERYEKYLKSNYADVLAELTSNAIFEYIKRNTGREHYVYICRKLRGIIKLGARSKAEEIIQKLKAKYPQRRALMEELRGV